MRRPSRRCLSTLGFAVCALGVVVAPAAADAQQQDGWRGSISVVYAFSGSAPGSSSTHREEAQYVFDGRLQPGTNPSPFLWDQATDWTASFHETRSVSEGCPEGAPFNSTANGNGTGTGRGRVQFQQFGTDPDWQYEIAAASTSAPFLVTVLVSCGGGVTFNQNAFGATNAFDGVWVRLPAGQTPQQTTTLEGQREFEDITFQGDHITVSWSLTREPDPPQCSNGIDDDLDGFTDFAGGVPGLRDPGCQSNDDDSEAHGTIVIDKQTRPTGSTQSFDFTGPTGGFAVTDQADPVRLDVEPGRHVIAEAELPGWRTSSIICDDSDSTGDPAPRTATVQLAVGEVVRCMFTNNAEQCATASPAWSARVVLPRLPDAELFRFSPSFSYCWDHDTARVTRAQPFGTVDVGVDTAVLAAFGFDLVYDPSEEQGTFSGNTGRAIGDFEFHFNALTLLNRFGFSALTNKIIRDQLEKKLARVLAKFGYGDDARALIADYLAKIRIQAENRIAKEAEKARRSLARFIGDGLASRLAGFAVDKLNGRLAQFHADMTVALSSEQFVGKSASEIGDVIAAHLIAVVEAAFTYEESVWTPTATIVVAPDGTPTFSMDGFVNPVLTIRREG